jgi:hypothetical protein
MAHRWCGLKKFVNQRGQKSPLFGERFVPFKEAALLLQISDADLKFVRHFLSLSFLVQLRFFQELHSLAAILPDFVGQLLQVRFGVSSSQGNLWTKSLGRAQRALRGGAQLHCSIRSVTPALRRLSPVCKGRNCSAKAAPMMNAEELESLHSAVAEE